ncbi:MAG TPA: DUF1214 domain-containing protein [Tianweitania sediminis]|jgi:hypothetical protein|nr:DUF1214 domain-containing protein [Tianweitania sediminis]
MLKTILLFALACAIAILGGAWSVDYVLNKSASFGAVSVGPWVAFPTMGTAEADPYMRARYARDGTLALGRAEGIAFRAWSDSSGALLSRSCDYAIEGTTPPARFWTLYASDAEQVPLGPVGLRQAALSSLSVLRIDQAERFTVTVSADPAPFNWLPLSGEGAFQLVLTLYDTPLANQTDAASNILPAIRRTGCHD